MTTKEEKLVELQQTIETAQKQMEEILKQPNELLTIEDCYNKVKPLYWNVYDHDIDHTPYWDGYLDMYVCNLPSKRHCLQIQAIQKMMVVAEALNEGWVANWGKNVNGNYKVMYDTQQNRVEVGFNSYNCENVIYFKDYDTARQAAEILGEETIKQAYGL